MPRPSATIVIYLAILGSCVASIAMLSATVDAQHAQYKQHGGGTTWEQGDAFSRALAAGMDKMHREMMAPQPTGNADVYFLATMIPHHAGAVEMARLVLIYGKDPLVRRLAEEIIAGQQAEIAAMEARLAILRKGDDPKPDGYPTLGSTRGPGG